MTIATDLLLGPIAAAAARFLPSLAFTPNVCILMLAIAGQESNLVDRRQKGNGPARGLWQFERGGGVVGVMTHGASAELARQVVKARGVEWSAPAIWAALETDDVLAACFARLLLWTDPRRVPDRADVQGAWEYYERNWRPGKPHRDRWDGNHAQAVQAVIGAVDA